MFLVSRLANGASMPPGRDGNSYRKKCNFDIHQTASLVGPAGRVDQQLRHDTGKPIGSHCANPPELSNFPGRFRGIPARFPADPVIRSEIQPRILYYRQSGRSPCDRNRTAAARRPIWLAPLRLADCVFMDAPTIPPDVLDRIRPQLTADERVVAYFEGNVGAELRFESSWLVLTDQRWLVLGPDRSTPWRAYPLSRVDDIAIVEHNGLSAIELRHSGSSWTDFGSRPPRLPWPNRCSWRGGS